MDTLAEEADGNEADPIDDPHTRLESATALLDLMVPTVGDTAAKAKKVRVTPAKKAVRTARSRPLSARKAALLSRGKPSGKSIKMVDDTSVSTTSASESDTPITPTRPTRRKKAAKATPVAKPTREEIVRVVTGRPPRRQAAAAAITKLSNQITETEEPTKKPAATKTPAAGMKKRKPVDDSDEEVATKKAASTKKKRKSADEAEEAKPSKKRKPDNPNAWHRKKSTLSNILPVSAGDVTKLRRLKPIIEDVDFDEMGEQVKVEFAELCQADEPLEPPGGEWHSSSGVTASCNRRFEAGFVDFLAFRKIYGHSIVPKNFPERPCLGRWVQLVRMWRTAGREDKLTASRLRRLDEAGFVWDSKAHPDFNIVMSTAKQADERWEKMFQMLLDYKDQNGHCNVPKESRFEKVPGVSTVGYMYVLVRLPVGLTDTERLAPPTCVGFVGVGLKTAQELQTEEGRSDQLVER
jgi:Helicase associated domain